MKKCEWKLNSYASEEDPAAVAHTRNREAWGSINSREHRYRGDCRHLKLECALGNRSAGPSTTLAYQNAETNSHLLRF